MRRESIIRELKQKRIDRFVSDFTSFWNRENRGHPLISARPRRIIPRAPGLFCSPDGRPFSPAQLQPDRFRAQFEHEYSYFDNLGDDFFWITNPVNLPYMEVMWGAPLYYEENGFWPGKPEMRVMPEIVERAVENGAVTAENEWADLYLEQCRYLQNLAEKRFGVGQYALRGPSDILLALRGSEHGVLDYFDHPDEVYEFLGMCTDSICALLNRQFKVLEPLEGGFCLGAMDQLWAPGRFVRLQEDAFSLLNPDIYREFLLPCDRRICEQFDYSLFHLHSGYASLVDDLMEIDSLSAVQITVDGMGPDVRELISMFRAVQEGGKNLVLRGEFSEHDVLLLERELSPRGLHVTIVIESNTVPEELDRLIKR